MALADIVKVTISRETTAVARASFGVPAVVAEFLTSKTTPAFSRARFYSGIDEMLAEGWLVTDPVYLAASGILRNNPRVPGVVVGRKDAADASWAAALAAVRAENATWYALTIVADSDPVDDDYLAVAAWAETQKVVFFLQATDAGVLDPASTTDIAAALKALGYDRTVVMYHAAANEAQRADATWVGEGLPFDPGSSTWAFKQLPGVAADSFTAGERAAALAKNANIYETVAGVSVTQNGTTVGGEFIDIINGVDWLESRLQENVYGLLVNARKVPYDDGGITIVAGAVQATLEEAARAGILQLDSIVLTVPTYAEIPQADRLARNLPDINFTALLLGAIHSVEIRGVVSV